MIGSNNYNDKSSTTNLNLKEARKGELTDLETLFNKDKIDFGMH